MSGGQIVKITAVDDPQLKNAEREKQAGSTRGFKTVRRPTRGITLKEETFATMRVVAGNGRNLHIIDAGTRLTKPDSTEAFTITLPDGREMRATDVYSNFLLQNIVDDRQEKAQILETFGEPYIFLFGERPRVMGFQGILLNSWDFNWEAEWWANYEHFLRGTRCVENDARVYLAFDNTIVGGYIISSNVQKTAAERHFLQFQFQLFVTYYETFSNLGRGEVSENWDRQGAELNDQERAELLAAGRPELIPTTSYSAYEVGIDGKVTTLLGTTDQALAAQAQPSKLAEAWRKIQRTTNLVLSTASQVWAGEVVRVPEGFAGSFAFDDTVTVKEQTKVGSQVVKYTTFDQNTDEYVGESAHYGSAYDTRFTPRAASPYELFSQGQDVVAEAKKLWRRAGIEPDPTITTTLAKAVKIGRLALMGVNLARGIAAGARHKVDSVKDFSGGLFNWGNIYGGMSKRSDDNPYKE